MDVAFQSSVARGTVAAPPSKSVAHRLLICAALAGGEAAGACVRNAGESDDVHATRDCLRALFDDVGTDEELVLPCRESASTLRFLVPLAVALRGKATFVGSERLMERPLGVYEQVLASCGASLERGVSPSGSTCVTVRGTLQPGEFAVPGDVSSQFVSGLLFALPLLASESVIRLLPPFESRPYVELTIAALELAGIRVTWEDKLTLRVPGVQCYKPFQTIVEGDWSNAAPFAALDALGGSVEITGLSAASLQADRVFPQLFAALRAGCPQLDVRDCPDLAPILFVVAAACKGARFSGTRRLAFKESDRLRAMASELAKCGVAVEIAENGEGVFVPGGQLHAPSCVLQSHHDHRIAMALSVLLAQTGGQLAGAQAVSKSFPDFFGVLARLGVKCDVISE